MQPLLGSLSSLRSLATKKFPYSELLREAQRRLPSDLSVGLGLRQVHHAAALFPHAALLEQVDALETLEDVALGCDGAGGTEAAMLG
jgi:hypothetical protein